MNMVLKLESLYFVSSHLLVSPHILTSSSLILHYFIFLLFIFLAFLHCWVMFLMFLILCFIFHSSIVLFQEMLMAKRSKTIREKMLMKILKMVEMLKKTRNH